MSERWIKLRASLPRDGRVRRMARALGLSTTHIVGALAVTWSLADEFCGDDGILEGYALEDLDDEVGIQGFSAALPSDWLEIRDDCLVLPNYTEHNGSTTKTRALKSRRQAKWRAGDGRVDGGASTAASTRGEERRGEKKKGGGDPIPWERHLERARQAIDGIRRRQALAGVGPRPARWTKLDTERKRAIDTRAADLGISLHDPDTLWDAIDDVLRKMDVRRFQGWNSLDLVTLIRTTGINHFQRAADNGYLPPEQEAEEAPPADTEIPTDVTEAISA